VLDSNNVEEMLDWAEYRMAQHHNKEDFRACLAIAQEFDEWFTTKNGENYEIYSLFHNQFNHD
jgi:hypothetical protein